MKQSIQFAAHRFSVAPMLDWTDRHCRYFHRQFTSQSLLYTEMVTTGAILYGNRDFLFHQPIEDPVALQLGGSDAQALATCAQRAEAAGYSEINLNVGCPSDRVQNGRFGACLMKEPQHVAQCITAMKSVVDIPVTVKTRIGVDEHDSYDFLQEFINIVSKEGGCDNFIIHARKAWLKGLSPKENREIPPLDYSRVYQIKQDFPHLTISINGGIQTITQVQEHLQHVDGVMVGRQAYQQPYLLATVDQEIFGLSTTVKSRHQIIESLYPYIEQELSKGTPLNRMTKCLLGLFQQQVGAKQWRRYISENAHRKGAGLEVVQTALQFVER